MVFQWIKSGYQAVQKVLSSTKKNISTKLQKLFGRYVDDALLEEIEAVLYEADLGVSIVKELSGKIRLYMQKHPKATAEEIISVVETGLIEEMKHLTHALSFAAAGQPSIFLIVGANGNGKTTSCAKLAFHMKTHENKSVLIGACDTFRAAAQEQIAIWADRLDIDIVRGKDKGDPAAVAFDAISKAKAKKIDVVILDTAGRLENKTNLLQELEKLKRSCEKAAGNAAEPARIPHETLLVLDSSTGQNGVEQAKAFNAVTPISGIILTKLDGSAKGGTAIAIQKQLGIPVKFIGVGEGLSDLIPFNSELFVQALLYDEKDKEL